MRVAFQKLPAQVHGGENEATAGGACSSIEIMEFAQRRLHDLVDLFTPVQAADRVLEITMDAFAGICGVLVVYESPFNFDLAGCGGKGPVS